MCGWLKRNRPISTRPPTPWRLKEWSESSREVWNNSLKDSVLSRQWFCSQVYHSVLYNRGCVCVCVCGVDFSGHFHRLSCSGINSCSHRENVFFFNLHHMNTVQRQTLATRAPWQPTAAAGNTCFQLFSRECFHHLHLLTFSSKCMNVHIYAHIFIYSLYICIYRGRDIDQTDQWLALALGSNDSVDFFYLITNWLD